MLVYLKLPMGATEIDGVKVYGKYYNYGRCGPTTVKKAFFYKYQEVLEAAPITNKWLDEQTGKKFPECSFTFNKMFLELSNETLLEIAKLLGIDYIKPISQSTNEELNWLRRSVRYAIENLS